ncbi:acyl-CoA hydrolase 2-like isoform X2 [Aristolochia californica]|uniref:acyl-CoA hydrolase 2-like isoform X2 n=1 Tax=Aristolochia californica TaxID=171875 RepID=UPI0035DBE330
MDRESVMEFLGHVPLLQRLPSSSLRKIAQVVEFKHYDVGDLIVQEGESGDGVYFIWEGDAEVSGNDNDDKGNQPELHLKKYDYFGYGAFNSIHEVNITAVSKLTCLVLRHEYRSLMQPKSIWNADETMETFSMVEHILKLEPLEVDLFRGFTLPDAPRFGQVFGGQTIGQALAAACKTVDCLKLVHSFHACFLLAGDINMPMLYKVHRLRDGKSFATRKVEAFQEGNLKFTLIASFQKEEAGFDHQEVMMPAVPAPEMLLPMEELRERRIFDPLLPIDYRNKIAKRKYIPWPIEIRFCERTNSTNYTKTKPSLKYWFKTRGKLSDDPALHRCVVAYASDFIFLGVSLNPHRKDGFKTASLTLDHSMWFHRPCRADEWLLYVMESPSAYNARGFCSGRMFNRKGELVVSLTQEGVIRKAKATTTKPKSKL